MWHIRYLNFVLDFMAIFCFCISIQYRVSFQVLVKILRNSHERVSFALSVNRKDELSGYMNDTKIDHEYIL